MNLKVLFVVFLCLLSASIICSFAAITLNVDKGSSFKEFPHTARIDCLENNGTDPQLGDPIDPPGWP